MTGEQHYREAERLLAESVRLAESRQSVQDVQSVVMIAQVHATLAGAYFAAQHHMDLRSPDMQRATMFGQMQ